MTYGTIEEYDRDNGHGNILPEHGGDTIPFDRDSLAEGEDPDALSEGTRVIYEVIGGLAGISASKVRRAAG